MEEKNVKVFSSLLAVVHFQRITARTRNQLKNLASKLFGVIAEIMTCQPILRHYVKQLPPYPSTLILLILQDT